MSIEHAILGMLSWQPLTGYDLKRMFAGSQALYWSGNNNQIYKSLLKLYRENLVTRETQMQESLPPRKIYRITEDGMRELKKWVCASPELPQLRHSFLVQLAWSSILPEAELEDLISRYEAEVKAQLTMLQAQRKREEADTSDLPRNACLRPSQARTSREAIMWSMILANWEGFYQHELSWLIQLREEVFRRDLEGLFPAEA
jgi:DNA-binding PadR family transcriptional regulator